MQLTLRLHLDDGRRIRVHDPDTMKVVQEEKGPGVFHPLPASATVAGIDGLLARTTTVEVLWGDQPLTSFRPQEWDESLRPQAINLYPPTWLARLLSAAADQRGFPSRHSYIVHLLISSLARELPRAMSSEEVRESVS